MKPKKGVVQLLPIELLESGNLDNEHKNTTR